MRCVFLVVCLLSSVTAANLSHAQESSNSPEDEASVFFSRARELFKKGDFELSAVMLREAIELYDVAAMHYNLARALQELGKWQEALDEYRLYLKMDPKSPERDRIHARIALLETRIAGEAPPVPEVDPEPVVPPPAPDKAEKPLPPKVAKKASKTPMMKTQAQTPSAVPWVLLGGGLLTLGGGVIAGAISNSAVSDTQNAVDQLSALSPSERAKRSALTANTLFVVGGALAITGLIWGLLNRRKARPVQVDVGMGHLMLRGQF